MKLFEFAVEPHFANIFKSPHSKVHWAQSVFEKLWVFYLKLADIIIFDHCGGCKTNGTFLHTRGVAERGSDLLIVHSKKWTERYLNAWKFSVGLVSSSLHFFVQSLNFCSRLSCGLFFLFGGGGGDPGGGLMGMKGRS